jgi:hypothetical protein
MLASPRVFVCEYLRSIRDAQSSIVLCARYKPRTQPKALKSIGRYEVRVRQGAVGQAALTEK